MNPVQNQVVDQFETIEPTDGISRSWPGLSACELSAQNALIVLRRRATAKESNQVFRQINGVVGNLLQAAGGKNQMDILFIICQPRLAM
jgi:hypothetical protein